MASIIKSAPDHMVDQLLKTTFFTEGTGLLRNKRPSSLTGQHINKRWKELKPAITAMTACLGTETSLPSFVLFRKIRMNVQEYWPAIHVNCLIKYSAYIHSLTKNTPLSSATSRIFTSSWNKYIIYTAHKNKRFSQWNRRPVHPGDDDLEALCGGGWRRALPGRHQVAHP